MNGEEERILEQEATLIEENRGGIPTEFLDKFKGRYKKVKLCRRKRSVTKSQGECMLKEDRVKLYEGHRCDEHCSTTVALRDGKRSQKELDDWRIKQAEKELKQSLKTEKWKELDQLKAQEVKDQEAESLVT